MARSSLLLGLILGFLAAPAQAYYFHLSENGLCNHTDQDVEFWMQADDESVIDHQTGFQDKRHGVLAPGACATARFNLDGVGWNETVTFTIGKEQWTVIFELVTSSPGGDKSIHNHQCDGELACHDGDEHFQIDINGN